MTHTPPTSTTATLHDDARAPQPSRPTFGEMLEELIDLSVGLAEEGRTMLGGIPRPFDLALFTQEFEDEVQGAFPPRWLQRIVLAPLAWLARRRGHARLAARPLEVRA